MAFITYPKPITCMCIVLGDPRSNQNPALLSFGILLFKWHNVLAERVQFDHPDWSDEEVFQKARRFVVATLQVCTMYYTPRPPYSDYHLYIYHRLFNISRFIILNILLWDFLEHNRLRIYSRVLGSRTARVYGLQAGRTPRH